MNLATLDIVLLVIVGLSCLMGVMRGLVKELLSLAAWVLAFVLASYFSGELAESLAGAVEAEAPRLVMAFSMIFIGTLILAAMVQWLIGKLVQTTGLTGTDRLLGLLFGGARGVLVCIVALIALRPFAEDTRWWQASMLREELLAFESDVLALMGKARDAAEQVVDESGQL